MASAKAMRFMSQYANFGLKYPVCTGETGADDACASLKVAIASG